MRARRVALAAAAIGCTTVVLAGCGGGGEPSTGDGTTARSSRSSTREPGPTATSSPTSTRIDTRLTGMAVRGVEPGCVAIKSKGKTYQLSGDDARALAKQAGNDQQLGRVKVAGHFAPKGSVSTCMMGRIFVVVKLTKL